MIRPIRGHLQPQQYVEEVVGGQSVGLYIVTDISETLMLRPKCLGEIKNIKWFNIASLPRHLNEKSCLQNTGYHSGAFYWVLPFIPKLEQFIENRENDYFRNEDEELMKSLGLPTEFIGHLRSY